jgi:hypothetical protein
MHDSTAWTLQVLLSLQPSHPASGTRANPWALLALQKQAGDTPCYPTTKDNSLSKSAKAGIEAGGIVAGVIVLVAACIFLWRWINKKKTAKSPATTVELVKQQ